MKRKKNVTVAALKPLEEAELQNMVNAAAAKEWREARPVVAAAQELVRLILSASNGLGSAYSVEAGRKELVRNVLNWEQRFARKLSSTDDC